MKISWKPLDSDSTYLPFLGIKSCGVEPSERGSLIDINDLYRALKIIENDESNILGNVSSLKEHILNQIKNIR